MGWLWSSSQSEDNASSAGDNGSFAEQPTSASSKPDLALSDKQKRRIFSRAGFASQDEQADQELEKYLNSLSAQESASKRTASAKDSGDADTTTATTSTTPSLDRFHPDGTLNIHPEALYPSTMSCRQAFDEAFYCQSLGGKFNDIYRFGALQSCSEHWSAFWFCMRNRTMPTPLREERIRDHYASREKRKLQERGNSEDIWEIRTVGVRKAFQRDPDAEDGGEWPIKE